MKEHTFNKVNTTLYSETLDNGIEVYIYPKNDTKNFYMSISVKYGAKITKYKKNNKIYEVIPGSAHFLEHKVMALSENVEISKRINDLGSLANAWTSYNGTNYNIFGSINPIENLRLLLDIFYNTNINEKCVDEEKGIIGEEIDMYEDQISSKMFNHLYKNLFNNSYITNTVVGTRDSIDKITAASLNKIYNDYYVPNNTFIIICGNINPSEIMNEIKDYMSKLNIKPKQLPKRIKEKEVENVNVALEEIQKEYETLRVKYALKIPKKNFDFKNDTFLKYYLNMILSCNFDSTSELFEKYKEQNIVYNMSTGVSIVDDYVVVIINATCEDANIFLENISKDIKRLSLNKETFERKKKVFLKTYILEFDNIEDVEYDLCDMILMDNKVNYNEYDEIMNMDYKIASKLLKQIKSDNISIIKTIK